MPFTPEHIEKMQNIFKHMEPSMISSIQFFKKEEVRCYCTFGIQNKWSKWICIFQNFDNIKPYQLKILNKRKMEIPFEIYITYPSENITRIGWKKV